MKNALMAVAITALMGGLVIAPVTQQTAEAQVYGDFKSPGRAAGGELLTLGTRPTPTDMDTVTAISAGSTGKP